MSIGIKRGLFAMIIGILVILGATGLFGWMILKEILSIEHMDLMAAGVLILGSGAAAFTCGRGEGRIQRILTAEIGILLFLGLVNLLLFDGALTGLIPCFLLIAGTAAAVMLTGNGKSTGRYAKGRSKKHPISKLNKKYSR